ncbi:MAG: helix-turn-helix transcriptional regulator [Alphaproteobacteria bacterium]
MTPLSLSIEEVLTATGLGRTKLYQLISSGKLKARKIGKRTIILQEDLQAFLANLPEFNSKAEGAA